MRLASSSHKRELLAIAVVLALGLLASLLASGASARPASNTTAVVPDGAAGVNKVASGEYLVFQVRNRRVRKLEFQIQVECKASDSPTIEPRFFSADADAPQGHLIPANGKLKLGWEERGGGRLGEIEVNLKFGTPDSARIIVIVPEEDGPEEAPEEAKESCTGGAGGRVGYPSSLA
ncbi:MAG: hypothetical protein H0X42_04135 [Solirubrobacterales bacterium]|nr:hypothetical protein [Solirubrobacterales bacterium]